MSSLRCAAPATSAAGAKGGAAALRRNGRGTPFLTGTGSFLKGTRGTGRLREGVGGGGPRRWGHHPRRVGRGTQGRVQRAQATIGAFEAAPLDAGLHAFGDMINPVFNELGLDGLGVDVVIFLVTTVMVVPVFRILKLSPVIGFLGAGLAISQMGVYRQGADIQGLSELGILFLLFEMGLELSVDRVKALAKYAFGLGNLQVFLTTVVFSLFVFDSSYFGPNDGSIGSFFLTEELGADRSLVTVGSLIEAVVIGAGLSLSSSAFVLQLLSEQGQLKSRFGSAVLGILLMQDIAVVPLLVLLPTLAASETAVEGGTLLQTQKALGTQGAGLIMDQLRSLLPLLEGTVTALGGLGGVVLASRIIVRRAFNVVAGSRSPEAFIALTLLTVVGTSLITEEIGLSDSLGAFLAGLMLAESNFRTQIEADIKPFRGLLLGLFFVTVGTNIDLDLFYREWPTVLAMLAGLITMKTGVVAALSPLFGLTFAEGVRTGLTLSQGGEFAFVVFSLAQSLSILPDELNRLLIIVVVLSMGLTPAVADLGGKAAAFLEKRTKEGGQASDVVEVEEQRGTLGLRGAAGDAAPSRDRAVVILGYGRTAKVVAQFFEGSANGCVVFTQNPAQVRDGARQSSYPVIYGDGSRAEVLEAAGITKPSAILVLYTEAERALRAVASLRDAYGPSVPMIARATDPEGARELALVGATTAIPEATELGLFLGAALLENLQDAAAVDGQDIQGPACDLPVMRGRVYADQGLTPFAPPSSSSSLPPDVAFVLDEIDRTEREAAQQPVPDRPVPERPLAVGDQADTESAAIAATGADSSREH